MKNIRTRFAPSPTGFLHIGGLRTALYCYLFARKNNGTLVLRIEDTDRSRLVDGSVDNIISSLKWAGIDYDEGPIKDGKFGPYFQSKRLEIYHKYVDGLLKSGHAYHCFCTKDRLDEVRAAQRQNKQPTKYDGYCLGLSEKELAGKIKEKGDSVVRLKVPKDQIISFDDVVRGTVSIKSSEVDDQVLLKSDGFPTYHLANVVDDHLMEITHIIRGEEWLSSTPKHVLLYKAFGWDIPSFSHLPLLLNEDKSKLSKRQNDVSVGDYIEQGYLPEAVVNFVALLGWNPGDDKEVLSMDDMINQFSLEKVHKAGAVFDRTKLDWINGLYIRNLSNEELYTKSVQYYNNAKIDVSDKEYVMKIVGLEKTRIKIISELPELTRHFFEGNLEYSKDLLKWKKGTLLEARQRLESIRKYILEYTGDWNLEVLESLIKEFIQSNELGMGNTLWPLRFALCGKEKSPSPFELLYVLGSDRALKRIGHAISLLASE